MTVPSILVPRYQTASADDGMIADSGWPEDRDAGASPDASAQRRIAATRRSRVPSLINRIGIMRPRVDVQAIPNQTPVTDADRAGMGVEKRRVLIGRRQMDMLSNVNAG